MGLTVYVASQYPYMSGFDYPGPGGPTDATNYFAPFAMLTIAPDFVFEGDYYLIAGDVGSARQIVYELHQPASAPDLFAPFGATDTPMPGSNVSGVIQVAGWAFDDGNVTKVEILVDGTADGAANYGSPRPDVAAAYPHAPTNVGYSYALNTAKYSNGTHLVNVRVTDAAGNVAVLADIRVSATN